MREVWEDLKKWRAAGQPAALATVVKVNGSVLRQQGAKMAVCANGRISGSVTGGCVEGAVFEEGQAALKSGKPRLVTFGGPDATEWDVGLVCGGSIQVFIESMAAEPWQAIAPVLDECLEGRQAAVLAVVVAGEGLGRRVALLSSGRQYGDLGDAALNRYVAESFLAGGGGQGPQLVTLPAAGGETSLYIEYLLPRPRLIIVGAVHLAIPLAALAKTMNFRTIVIDARSAFATPERFPDVDELIVEWPGDALAKLELDPSACVVCLSHDPKLDNPALAAALNSPAGYIGALGSRRAHAKRLDDLREAGLDEQNLRRIHAPIGLDLGARQPEEIALAILAEIVAERRKVPAK